MAQAELSLKMQSMLFSRRNRMFPEYLMLIKSPARKDSFCIFFGFFQPKFMQMSLNSR